MATESRWIPDELSGSGSGRPPWFAEIELRGYLRRTIPEEVWHRFDVPAEPDKQMADWAFDGDHVDRDIIGKVEENHRTIDTVDPVWLDVQTDRVVVPLDTVMRFEGENLVKWIRKYVLDGMAVSWEGGKVGYGQYDESPYGKTYKDTIRPVDGTRIDPRPVYVQVPPDHELCGLSELWKERRRQGRDVKMLVTARNGATGTGKTTLAVALAETWDANGWDASKATLSPKEYVSRYTELEPGEILIGDEMEQMADPRRSMSKQNVTLTQYWSTMRQWEVSTICTLPSASMIDKRLRELMDVRVNVQQRGVAVAYRKTIDDHSGEIKTPRMHRIRWDALDDDPEYAKLARMKREHMENFSERAYFLANDDEEEIEDPEEAVQAYRNERLCEAYETGEWTQKELADVFDLSRPRVSQIVNEET